MELNKEASNKRRGLILAGFTFLPVIYWALSVWFIKDVYKYAIVGAIYELLWLPMIILLFGIPIISASLWANEKWSFKTTYPFCIIVTIYLILRVILNN